MRDLNTDPLCDPSDLGRPIPDSPHAVSVCLPHWKHVVGYEEGDPAIIETFCAGYPRFFLHPIVRKLCVAAENQFAKDGESVLVFPSPAAAGRCAELVKTQTGAVCRLESIGWDSLTAAVMPESSADTALKFWQHGGEIVSSRLAETALAGDALDPALSAAGAVARQTIQKRLAKIAGQNPDDVFLFSSGMAAIFAVHRALGKIRPGLRSVQVEFPYVDAFKVQQHFGPGVHDLSICESGGTSEVARLLSNGKSIAAVYTELPSNPLLRTADLSGLAKILGEHEAPLIVDDTIATAANVDSFRFADVVTTSLTKIFSGAGDVMAGAVTLRADSPFHDRFHQLLTAEVEDAPLFAPDAVVLEENSRDFADRIPRINDNAAALFEFLAGHPKIEHIWYPKTETQENYATTLKAGGGYSGLMSIVLRESENAAPRFYDALRVSKGPSLGTNFTLACPYTLLAHYQELDWAEKCGVDSRLIRIWTGLEAQEDLIERFREALDSA